MRLQARTGTGTSTGTVSIRAPPNSRAFIIVLRVVCVLVVLCTGASISIRVTIDLGAHFARLIHTLVDALSLDPHANLHQLVCLFHLLLVHLPEPPDLLFVLLLLRQ